MRRLRKNSSGQVLILTALLIALIVISAEAYVLEVNQALQVEESSSPVDFARIVRIGSRNLMIGSLANISQGGDNQTLRDNLERWISFVKEQYYHGECTISFELCETSPYSSGLWMSWGADGSGVTSAKTDFSLNLTSEGAEINVDFSINVTTSISVYAISVWESGIHTINVTISLYNEGDPALAKNITVYYWTKAGWADAGLLGSYNLEDFGNGTYRATFTVGAPRTWNRPILVNCYDQREIYVQASTTCVDL